MIWNEKYETLDRDGLRQVAPVRLFHHGEEFVERRARVGPEIGDSLDARMDADHLPQRRAGQAYGDDAVLTDQLAPPA